MHGAFGIRSPGKASSRSTALPRFFFFLSALFSYSYTTGCQAYCFTTDGYGSLNLAHKFGCVPYTRRGVRHKRVCTSVDSEGQKNCPPPCPPKHGIEPRVFGFQFRLSDQLATSPVP